ncbi:MAG: CpsD/CapB family tyrosine-protein kinase [Lentisphaeria bacterium]|nr:CpsD/CapB family tyrosine-protein kinase [Lentisphaeria bacterium]
MRIFPNTSDKWHSARRILCRGKFFILSLILLGMAAGGVWAELYFPWISRSQVSVFIFRNSGLPASEISNNAAANNKNQLWSEAWGEAWGRIFEQKRIKIRLDEYLRKRILFSAYKYQTRRSQYTGNYCLVELTVLAENKDVAYHVAEQICVFCREQLPDILQTTCIAAADHGSGNSALVWSIAVVLSGIFLGGAAGLTIGGALCWAFDAADRSMRDIAAVEEWLQKPLLGVLPHVDKKSKQNSDFAQLTQDMFFRQAAGTLQLNVNFLAPASGRARVYMISSVTGQEGKSTVSLVLAQNMAAAGSRVLLICADYRGSSLREFVDSNLSDSGFFRVLTGSDDWRKCIEYAVLPNLDLLVSGGRPDDPATLFSQRSFEQFLRQVADSYDYIFIDAPSMQNGSDPLLIGRLSDAALLVGDYRNFQRARLELLLWRFQKTNVKFGGLIVNHYPARTKWQEFARCQHFYSANTL